MILSWIESIVKCFPEIFKLNTRTSIILDHFDNWEFSFFDPIHELPGTVFLVSNFIDFLIKELFLCFLDCFFEFLPIVQTSWLIVCIKVSSTVVIPSGFGMPWNIDIFGVLLPQAIDKCSKWIDHFFKGIDVSNGVSLEILYRIIDFHDKLFLFFAIFNKDAFRDLKVFFNNRNGDGYKCMIRGEPPIWINMMGVYFSWIQSKKD